MLVNEVNLECKRRKRLSLCRIRKQDLSQNALLKWICHKTCCFFETDIFLKDLLDNIKWVAAKKIISKVCHWKNFMTLFLWTGFNCFKAAEPIQRDSFLFTTRFSGVPAAHLIDLGGVKNWDVPGTNQLIWT